jgi:hypothetical protein
MMHQATRVAEYRSMSVEHRLASSSLPPCPSTPRDLFSVRSNHPGRFRIPGNLTERRRQ